MYDSKHFKFDQEFKGYISLGYIGLARGRQEDAQPPKFQKYLLKERFLAFKRVWTPNFHLLIPPSPLPKLTTLATLLICLLVSKSVFNQFVLTCSGQDTKLVLNQLAEFAVQKKPLCGFQ